MSKMKMFVRKVIGRLVFSGFLLGRIRNVLTQRKLRAVYDGFSKSEDFDKRVPPPEVFSLYAPAESLSVLTPEGYRKAFSSIACLRELPELLKLAGYCDSQETFSFFDYGCGYGRLAYAYTNFFGTALNRRYFGYEILPPSVDFLRSVYADYPNIKIIGGKIQFEKSYIEIGHLKENANDRSANRANPNEFRLAERDVYFDAQFSHSVFTHMDREAIVNVLKEFAGLPKPPGVCINTWLVIDDFAEASLRAGLANRKLPYEVDGYFTYDKDNPLICSAYRLKDVEKIYKEAGHEIVDILWGDWTGRLPAQQFSAQDVVISKPLKR